MDLLGIFLTENKIIFIENKDSHKESWLTGTAYEETGENTLPGVTKGRFYIADGVCLHHLFIWSCDWLSCKKRAWALP